MEVQRIGIPFPARTPMRYPYLAQVLDTSQTLVKGVPAAPVGVVGQAGAVVAHRTMVGEQHGAGEPLSLAALDQHPDDARHCAGVARFAISVRSTAQTARWMIETRGTGWPHVMT